MPLHAPTAGKSASCGGAQHGLSRDGGVAFDLERLVLTLPEARTGFYHVHAQALAKIWEPFWCERQKAPESERGSLAKRRPTRAREIKSYRFAVRRRSFISVPLPGPSSTSCVQQERRVPLRGGLGKTCATLSFPTCTDEGEPIAFQVLTHHTAVARHRPQRRASSRVFGYCRSLPHCFSRAALSPSTRARRVFEANLPISSPNNEVSSGAVTKSPESPNCRELLA